MRDYCGYFGKVVCFEYLKGKTIVEVLYDNKPVDLEDQKDEVDVDTVRFVLDTGESLVLYHERECCESVWLSDVTGDWRYILNETILFAELTTSSRLTEGADPEEAWPDEYENWSFYKLATNRGFITLAWKGVSNGYYSTSVQLEIFNPDLGYGFEDEEEGEEV